MALTGKDLLDTLSTLTEEELSRPVYVYADHGQEQYQANHCLTEETTTSYEYCLEEYYVHTDDRAEYPTNELKRFIEIS